MKLPFFLISVQDSILLFTFYFFNSIYIAGYDFVVELEL